MNPYAWAYMLLAAIDIGYVLAKWGQPQEKRPFGWINIVVQLAYCLLVYLAATR